MRTSKLIVPVLLAGLAVAAGQAKTPQPPPAIASFHGIGDLPGGPINSTVRDATKHNGVIYAVGASVSINQPTLNTNAPVIWTWDGTNGVLTALPEIATSFFASPALAVAITRDAAFIAGQVHVLGNKPTVHAVRVARAALPSVAANVNLNASPYPAYTFTARINNVVEASATTGATAISDNGAILYGTAILGDATVTPRTDFTRAVRFDINAQTSALIPLLGAGHVGNNPVSRGTSSDGSVMVGTSNGLAGSGILRAFRYVHGSGVSAIPLLPGGTTNRSIAVSPDGNLTLVTGPSTFLPRGEVYIHNATTNALTRLGSPMTPWQPSAVGGMTADGAVVAMTYSALPITCAPTPCTPPTPSRNAYIRNANGWFHFTNVLTEAGVDISQNWESIQINGMSPDGTLVFGQARHNDELEGFVAEFPAGYLAGFDMPAVPPADTSIVGVYRLTDPDPNPATANDVILAFLADGTFFHMEANNPASEHDGANGFERGRYFWNAATGALSIAILQDTNGDIGFSDVSGQPNLVATVAGGNLTLSVTGCVPSPEVEDCTFTASPLTGAAGSIVGGWSFGNPAVDDSSGVFVFLPNGQYYLALDDVSVEGENGQDGIEFGTYAWNAATGDFLVTVSVDTNLEWGFSHPSGLVTLRLSPDELRLVLAENGVTLGSLNRIAVARATTVAGANITVQPITPSGTTPVTVQFGQVTSSGETTLQVIDPALASSPAPPPGFSLGDPPLYYELGTTATFTGPVTVCFNYAGISFGTGSPRLFHYEGGAWVDITTSVDAATSTLCGSANSFSPFAIFVSPVARTGFYAPVSDVPGFLNTVKSGSTVPLKFNVYVNGVEKTTTSDLVFSVVSVSCTAGAGEDPVDFTTTGNTSLRYDTSDGHFVQNWKTPKAIGCYLVRMTTTQDNVSLTALFKLK